MKEHIDGQVINLCKEEIKNKKITNSQIVYDASGDVIVSDTDFDKCTFVIEGRAKDALDFFNILIDAGAMVIKDGKICVTG